MAEDVHVEERGALELEHEEERIEDDQEEDEILKRSRCTEPPQLIAARQTLEREVQLGRDYRIPDVSDGTYSCIGLA